MKTLSQLDIKNKKYIIFDLDGTLIDSVGIWNLTDQKVIEKYGGLHVDDLDRIKLERESFVQASKEKNVYLAYSEHLIQKYNLSIKRGEELLKIRWSMSGEIFENDMDFKPGVVQLILRLKGLGFKFALATMSTQFQLDIYSKKNKRMYEQLNIEDTFDYIVRKEDVEKNKPDPEIYLKIMQFFGAKPAECLVFEDSYEGVMASKNAGIEVVNIYDQYPDTERPMIDEITDYSIKSYGQFTDFVNRVYPNVGEKST